MIASRTVSAAGLLLSIAAMTFAIGYLQIIEYLDPCPLCVLDRIVVISLGVVFLLCLLHNPARIGRRIYSGLGVLLSATGIGICLRHIWLQNLPADKVPDCGAGFWYMMDSMPLLQFLDTILNSSGECAEIKWQFLGFTIPEWTLVLFVVFGILSICLFFSHSSKDQQTI